jgi:hypothetical protein
MTRLTASGTATWKKRATTFLWRFVFSPLITCMHAAMLAMVLLVLVPWLALDYLPKRRSKPLTSQIQNRHRRPHLRRDGSSVFWEMPNGEIIPLEGIEASLALQEAAEVVGGALTYELTKIPHKN